MSIGEHTIAFILSLCHLSYMVDDPISPYFHAKLILEETHFAILYSKRGFCPFLHQVAFLLLNMKLAAKRWVEKQSEFVFFYGKYASASLKPRLLRHFQCFPPAQTRSKCNAAK